jgi:hypothetical protein
MLEGKPTPAGSSHAAPGYSYPGDLARFVRDRWRDVPGPPGGVDPLPDAAALEGSDQLGYPVVEGRPGRQPRLRPRVALLSAEFVREPA